MSVRQSCWVLSLHTAAFVHCVFLRHRASISSAALCEENTRCCMWSLILATRCHGNTNQNSSVHKWGRQGERERVGNRMDGVTTQRSCQSKTVTQFIQAAPNELQGEQAMNATECDLCKQRWQGKKTSSEESEEVTVKTEQPATCCMICQGEKKVTKLKRGSFGKSSKTDEPAVWLQPPPEERTEISRLHGQDRLPHRVKTRANRYLISPWGHASHTHLSPKFNPWAPPPTHTKWEMGQTSFLQSGLLFMKDKDITLKKTHVCKWKTFQRQLQHMRLGQKWLCIL